MEKRGKEGENQPRGSLSRCFTYAKEREREMEGRGGERPSGKALQRGVI